MSLGGIVVGASAGVGRALALKLHERGHLVTAVSRRAPCLGEGIATSAADVRDFASLESAVLAARERGPVDYVVNCVGVGFYAPIGDDRSAVWTSMLTTNVTGLLCLLSVIERQLPALRTFVHVSSTAAHRPSRTPGNICYSAAKTAARVIVDEYRKQLREAGSDTRVCMVSPGLIEGTDFDRNFYSYAMEKDSRQDLYGAYASLSADQVAETIHSILSLPPTVEIIDMILAPVGQM